MAKTTLRRVDDQRYMELKECIIILTEQHKTSQDRIQEIHRVLIGNGKKGLKDEIEDIRRDITYAKGIAAVISIIITAGINMLFRGHLK